MDNSSRRMEILELILRAERFQNAGNLTEAKTSIEAALKLDPDNLELLETAACLYAAVPEPDEARRYAFACRDKAARIVEEMDRILGSQTKKQLSARHIGGIIGPY